MSNISRWQVLAVLAVVCLTAVSVGGEADAAEPPRLERLWDWFEQQLVHYPCVREPSQMIDNAIIPGAVGRYVPSVRMVLVGRGQPAVVAIHEFAHHYWYVCHVQDRPLGRRWLRVDGGHDWWDTKAQEEWASTLTWLLTNDEQVGGDVRPRTARTFAPRVVNPAASRASWLVLLGSLGASGTP